MTTPRETARQIAERITARILVKIGHSTTEEVVAMIEAEFASLTADLAQARQERDDALQALDANWVMHQRVVKAEQARDEALRQRDESREQFDRHVVWADEQAQSAARTALLEAAAEAMTRANREKDGSYERMVLFSLSVWLTTRAGGPRT
jgi:hypothetical protein